MIDLYKHYVRERHRAWARRQMGEPAPWSFDPIIASKKFTCDYRLLDRGSQFVIRNLLEPEVSPMDILARCFLYRVTNLPATWEYMHEALDRYPLASDMDDSLAQILHRHRDRGNRIFSGAYMIVPQPGKAGDKVTHAVELARTFLDQHAERFFRADTQEERFAVLETPYGMGRFLAMQVLTDYGYSPQCGVDRENQFVVEGPGARRGARLIDRDKKPVALIEDLTKMWEDDDTVRLHNRPLSLMDVQNTLCEFMKYARYIEKGIPSERTYNGLGPLPEPTVPEHFKIGALE
jgi:hypothetical protein